LVGFDAKPAGLDSEERSRPEGLFEEECLVVNEPVGEWSGAVRLKIVANWLNRLEGTKDIQFLAQDRVLGAAKAQKRLGPQIQAGDDFPAQPTSTDDCSRKQVWRCCHAFLRGRWRARGRQRNWRRIDDRLLLAHQLKGER
jgi:hypothetical protein